jgi:hypothetical protein
MEHGAHHVVSATVSVATLSHDGHRNVFSGGNPPARGSVAMNFISARHRSHFRAGTSIFLPLFIAPPSTAESLQAYARKSVKRHPELPPLRHEELPHRGIHDLG